MQRDNDSLFPALVYLCAVWMLMLTGCDDPKPVDIDPQAAGKLALEKYDNNSDGFLDGEEIKMVPAIAVARGRVDSNSDGKITAEEIAERLKAYEDQSEFIVAEITVKQNGRPLPDAEVVFDPEPFLGDSHPTYRGTTDQNGKTELESDPWTHGLQLGFYRVRISKTENGKESIADQYNTNSTLGIEIADDAPRVNRIAFNLKS